MNVEINSFLPDGFAILFLEASQCVASYGFKGCMANIGKKLQNFDMVHTETGCLTG